MLYIVVYDLCVFGSTFYVSFNKLHLFQLFGTVENAIVNYKHQVNQAFEANDLETVAKIVKRWRYYDNVLQKIKALQPVT